MGRRELKIPNKTKKSSPKIIKSSPKITKIEDDSPIRAVFCLKRKTMDMREIEEVEECFILDFDPFESVELSDLSPNKRCKLSDDNDLSVLAEKGKVACRDYPHPRHLCVKFPFDSSPHESHCNMCFCYVCEKAAPCDKWKKGLKHCDATDSGNQVWKLLRKQGKKG